MKSKSTKLKLHRETLTALSDPQLRRVAGNTGWQCTFMGCTEVCDTYFECSSGCEQMTDLWHAC